MKPAARIPGRCRTPPTTTSRPRRAQSSASSCASPASTRRPSSARTAPRPTFSAPSMASTPGRRASATSPMPCADTAEAMSGDVRTALTEALQESELRAIRSLMDAAFGTGEEAFADDDWQHALGGTHFLLEDGDVIVSHASVVQRALEIGGRPFRTGYVEAVATAPDRQGSGYGTAVMRAATKHIRATFELGALGTGA